MGNGSGVLTIKLGDLVIKCSLDQNIDTFHSVLGMVYFVID